MLDREGLQQRECDPRFGFTMHRKRPHTICFLLYSYFINHYHRLVSGTAEDAGNLSMRNSRRSIEKKNAIRLRTLPD